MSYDKLSIMVVDDQILVRSLIVQVLKGLGFAQERIFQAVDGMNALRSLNVRHIDAVLCDISMEPMCGLDLLKEVRMGRPHESESNMPFIFLSGHSERHNVELAVQLDADSFIVKPPKPADIEKALQSAFTRPRPAPAPLRYAQVSTGTEYDRSFGFRLGSSGFEISHSKELPDPDTTWIMPINEVEPDALLMADVMTPQGHILLRKGKRITSAQLRTLGRNIDIYGVNSLCIADESKM